MLRTFFLFIITVIIDSEMVNFMTKGIRYFYNKTYSKKLDTKTNDFIERKKNRCLHNYFSGLYKFIWKDEDNRKFVEHPVYRVMYFLMQYPV